MSNTSDPDATSRDAVVLFDGECNLCHGWVNFLIDRDPRAVLRFAALQSRAAAALLNGAGLASPADGASRAEHGDSIVFVDRGRAFDRSTAVLRILLRLGLPWSLLAVFLLVPRSVRDVAYSWVARHRTAWFGKRDACRLPTPALRARFLEDPS